MSYAKRYLKKLRTKIKRTTIKLNKNKRELSELKKSEKLTLKNIKKDNKRYS